MSKTILITGSTGGIGLATAEMLLEQNHKVLLHGRNGEKLKLLKEKLATKFGLQKVKTYLADLTLSSDVETLVKEVRADHNSLDVLVNNAGVFKTSSISTPYGLDTLFVVNTIAPYFLTQQLLSLLPADGRIVNLSSAAQVPVEIEALLGKRQLSDSAAYAQSKLALTIWSQNLAGDLAPGSPSIFSVNPASMLGSKMVKQAYGVDGADLRIGAEILTRATLSGEFNQAAGKYYDNDRKAFSSPHPDASNPQKVSSIMAGLSEALKIYTTAD